MVDQMPLKGQGDSEKKEPTLLEHLLKVPLFIFEDIVKYRDIGTLKKLQLLDDGLGDRCLAASRLFTYKPMVISFKDGKLAFEDLHTNIENALTPEEFENSRYKASTRKFELEVLTDDLVNKFFDMFSNRIIAITLHITDIKCDIESVAKLIKELKITNLTVGSENNDVYIEGFSFPIELIQHPVMNQISSLSTQVSLKKHNLDMFVAKNFTTAYISLDEASDAWIAQSFKKFLTEWLKNERDIQDYSFLGISQLANEHINSILSGWQLVDESEDGEYTNRRPLAISLNCDNYDADEAYKLIGYKNEELYLSFEHGRVYLTVHAPTEINSEIYDFSLPSELYNDDDEEDFDSYMDRNDHLSDCNCYQCYINGSSDYSDY